jgi:MFS family permease
VSLRILCRTLPDRVGGRPAAAAGAVLGVVGMAVPALLDSALGLYLAAAAFGACHALLYPAIVVLTVATARDDERSSAVGALRAAEAFGFAVSAPLLGLVAAHAGYRSVYGVAAVVTAGGLVALALGRHRTPTLTFDVR